MQRAIPRYNLAVGVFFIKVHHRKMLGRASLRGLRCGGRALVRSRPQPIARCLSTDADELLNSEREVAGDYDVVRACIRLLARCS